MSGWTANELAYFQMTGRGGGDRELPTAAAAAEEGLPPPPLPTPPSQGFVGDHDARQEERRQRAVEVNRQIMACMDYCNLLRRELTDLKAQRCVDDEPCQGPFDIRRFSHHGTETCQICGQTKIIQHGGRINSRRRRKSKKRKTRRRKRHS